VLMVSLICKIIHTSLFTAVQHVPYDPYSDSTASDSSHSDLSSKPFTGIQYRSFKLQHVPRRPTMFVATAVVPFTAPARKSVK
jgi:hypothetical protein